MSSGTNTIKPGTEIILCAAIWYKDVPLLVNDIPNCHLRPVNVLSGIVFCGHNHLQCLYQMIAMTGKRQAEAGEFTEGFLTSKNRFVDRCEGAMIALYSQQIKKLNYSYTKLFSEDLYI